MLRLIVGLILFLNLLRLRLCLLCDFARRNLMLILVVAVEGCDATMHHEVPGAGTINKNAGAIVPAFSIKSDLKLESHSNYHGIFKRASFSIEVENFGVDNVSADWNFYLFVAKAVPTEGAFLCKRGVLS